MSALDFLSPGRCARETLASPLARALAPPSVKLTLGQCRASETLHDLSAGGKVELRGDLPLVEPAEGDELIRLTPRRGLLLTGDPLAAIDRSRANGVLAYDMTGALAGLAFEGETLFRRLTDLDPGALPTAGGFARISAILVRDEGERFRAYFPQELGHYVVEVVLDALAGLVGAEHAQPLPREDAGEEEAHS